MITSNIHCIYGNFLSDEFQFDQVFDYSIMSNAFYHFIGSETLVIDKMLSYAKIGIITEPYNSLSNHQNYFIKKLAHYIRYVSDTTSNQSFTNDDMTNIFYHHKKIEIINDFEVHQCRVFVFKRLEFSQ